VVREREGVAVTRIYLLRHGATALNRAVPYRLQGRWSDSPLDEAGREQARRASLALRVLTIRAAYSSPLLRAAETARIVAEPHGIDVTLIDGLVEADLGRWEGLTWDEAQSQDPEWHARFHERPGTTPYPDGESFADTGARASAALSAIARAHAGERVIVVGHNVLNRAVLAEPLGLSIEQARSIRQENCGINVLEHDGTKIKIVSLNECIHLEADH
jgi:phosphoserine phosphatase